MYRILVVDDETHIREGIGEYLTEVGYEVVLCENGGEARQKFQEKEIDLVILDLIMPEKSGFVVLETIRKESDVPIIIFSGLEDEES